MSLIFVTCTVVHCCYCVRLFISFGEGNCCLRPWINLRSPRQGTLTQRNQLVALPHNDGSSQLWVDAIGKERTAPGDDDFAGHAQPPSTAANQDMAPRSIN